jgi:NADPH-dependent 2,4-dienoyl-CoA reductase/sulfur reductase-like enzyme
MTDETIVVVGAGPAGMRAALTLAEHGLRPVLIDEAMRSGGQIYRRPPVEIDHIRPIEKLYGFEAKKARRLHQAFDAEFDRIDYRPGSTIWSVDEERVSFIRDGRPHHIAWDRLVLATGAMDRIIPLPGWELPGCFSLGAAQIALKAQAVGIGARVAFFGTGPLLYLVAYQYAKAGFDVAAVLDTSGMPSAGAVLKLARGGATFAKGLYYTAWLMAHGITIERGIRPIAIVSDDEGAVGGLRYLDARGNEKRIEAPAVAFGYGLKPETQSTDLLGLDFAYDEKQRQWLPVSDPFGRSSNPKIYLAGDGAHVRGADIAELAGEQAALALLGDASRPVSQTRIDRLDRQIRSADPFRDGLEMAFPFPVELARSMPAETMLCRCEGLRAGAVRSAITETGECDINRVKAFTRLGMGRCQGRICMPAATEMIASHVGQSPETLGRLRGQAPIKPVSLSVIAGVAS